MLLKNLNLSPLFESVGSPFGSKGDLAILADNTDADDTPKPDKEVEEDSDDDVERDKSESEDDEEVESEEDSEEKSDKEETESEDDEEETEETEEYKAVPQIADIKKAFPDIFKKFPEVRAAIFRDQKFSEVFNTPREAEVASKKAETLDNMEADLMDGSSEQLFSAIKNSSDEAYNKLTANLLPTLHKLDKDLYLKVVAVPLKQALRSALAKGRRDENKNLEYSAHHLHKFLFDDDNIDSKAELELDAPKKTDAETKLEKELKERDERDLTNFQSGVNSTFESKAEKEFISNLDDSIAPRIKKYMFAEAMKEINEQLGKDNRYQGQMRQLWINARKSGFTAESKAKIVSTALARAKQLIPTVRAKIKKEMNLKSNENGNKKVVRREAPRTENRKQRNDKPQSDLDIIRS